MTKNTINNTGRASYVYRRTLRTYFLQQYYYKYASSAITTLTFSLALPACLDTDLAIRDPLLSAMTFWLGSPMHNNWFMSRRCRRRRRRRSARYHASDQGQQLLLLPSPPPAPVASGRNVATRSPWRRCVPMRSDAYRCANDPPRI